MSESIEVERTVGASPDRLHELESDLTMGRWSPEEAEIGASASAADKANG